MIFSRFYKQNEFSQGAGLGLSICQVIIEKLGGKIELKSEVGREAALRLFFLAGGILIMIDFNGNTNNLISCFSFLHRSQVNLQ